MTIDTSFHLHNTYVQLPEFFYRRVTPRVASAPRLVILNESLAAELGLVAEHLKDERGAALFVGNELPHGAEPLAQAYAGHQFGHFTMLGDGRAILLGEQVAPDRRRFDIQLKGSGQTPYSRRGDGLAALGPMLREYIISEAMHGLGIPTTRSLAVVMTGDAVYRETELPGAVLTRVAASHLRVGTFEYAANWGGTEQVQRLADYAIERHYPDLSDVADRSTRYLHFYRAVAERQATLIAKWMSVGFVHGVMNTDNMSISGETIDYGPCAFLDSFAWKTVFSSIDSNGRYAYVNQPKIATWNLARLAETLMPLFHEQAAGAVELAKAELARFDSLYEEQWLAEMKAKLGLVGNDSGDEQLVMDWLALLETNRADFTNAFLALRGIVAAEWWMDAEPFEAWRARWLERLLVDREPANALAAAHRFMDKTNPRVIPRNHKVEEALRAAEDLRFEELTRLVEAVARPFADITPELQPYMQPSDSSRPYRTFCGT
jgi:uncharacterized protein YdiU (UPF0061 family)